jgi:hypothetical protein
MHELNPELDTLDPALLMRMVNISEMPARVPVIAARANPPLAMPAISLVLLTS